MAKKKETKGTSARCHICGEDVDLKDLTEDPRNEKNGLLADGSLVVHARHQGVVAAFERMHGKVFPPQRETETIVPSAVVEVSP